MRVLFSGQVPKDLIYPDANEDALEFDIDTGRIAISDGASESFDSKTWAHILTKRFVLDPKIQSAWLSTLVGEYASHFVVSNLSWSKQAAFERGSFATLLGIEDFSNHGTIDVFSIGDSLAVLLDQNSLVATYPYSTAEEFQQRPALFSTSSAHNAFLESADFFSKHHVTWKISDKRRPVLLCMTDALGEWALRLASEKNPPWQLLTSISDVSQLQSLVMEEREHRRMRVDDVTLLRVEFKEHLSDELPLA